MEGPLGCSVREFVRVFSKGLPALAQLRESCTPGKQVLQRRFFGCLLSQLHPQTHGYMPLPGLLRHKHSNDVDLVQVTRAEVHVAAVIYMNCDFTLDITRCPNCSVHHLECFHASFSVLISVPPLTAVSCYYSGMRR